MLYRIHRIFLDFFHRPVLQKTRRFGNWFCFRPQVKVGEKTPTQLGPLERVNLNHWKQNHFPKSRFFLIQDDGKSPEKFCEFPFIVSHRQLLRHHCDAYSLKCRRNATHRIFQPSLATSSWTGFSWPETRNMAQISDVTQVTQTSVYSTRTYAQVIRGYPQFLQGDDGIVHFNTPRSLPSILFPITNHNHPTINAIKTYRQRSVIKNPRTKVRERNCICNLFNDFSETRAM
jgi:hypothetical protein